MKIIARAPTRISLFGGGTDTQYYAKTYGGVCFNFAINIRQEFTIYLDDKPSIVPIINSNQEFYSKILEEFGVGKTLSMYQSFDGTIESGLGSSASAAVALIAALARLTDRPMNRNEMAEMAWDIEVNRLGLFGGKQDQYCASVGGINVMEFKDEVSVTPLVPSFLDKIYPSFCLFYIGKNRLVKNIQEGLRKPTEKQLRALDQCKKIALEAIDPLAQGDIKRVGYLLTKAWNAKKKSNLGVTDAFIDNIYQEGIRSGALGGKLLGSGGGGHFLFLVNPQERKKFIPEMESLGLKWVDFSLDFNGVETRVIR